MRIPKVISRIPRLLNFSKPVGLMPDFRGNASWADYEDGMSGGGGGDVSRRGCLKAFLVVGALSTGLCRAVSAPYSAIVTGRIVEASEDEVEIEVLSSSRVDSDGLWATERGVEALALERGTRFTIRLGDSDCTRSGLPQMNKLYFERLPEEAMRGEVPVTMSIDFDVPACGCKEGPPEKVYVKWARVREER